MTAFDEQVRRLKAERGISLRRLAKSVHYDAGYLSKVVNGHKPPSSTLAARLDDALGADGMLVALVPERRVTSPGSARTLGSEHVRPSSLIGVPLSAPAVWLAHGALTSFLPRHAASRTGQ